MEGPSPASKLLQQSFEDEKAKIITFNNLYLKRGEIAPTSLDNYKVVKMIGKGAFGRVMLGIHKLTGKNVALKTIDKSYMKDDFQRRKVFQEVFILKKIRHSNVIRLLEVFESENHFFMVMEYAGKGDLLRYVKQRGKLTESEARNIFRGLITGLAHCHCRSILHRDIKLDNILLDEKKEIKICDFGVSKICRKGRKITEQCGTPAYIAPEIIEDKGYFGFGVDVWSAGVLLYAVLQGQVPFKATSMQDLYRNILKAEFVFPTHISRDAKDLI